MCSCRKLGLKTPTITHCIEPLYDSCSIYLILPILVLVYVGFIVPYNVTF